MGSLGIVPNLGQIYNPDSFTGDGSNTTFTLTHLVTSDQSIIWVEGGVTQKPGIDFTISGLTLTRTTAPANLVACFAMYLGVSLDIGVPSDSTITLAKMTANSIDSDQYVDGSIDAVHMSANSIDSDSYVDGSIDAVHLSANSVDSDSYVDGSIDAVHLSANSVDSDSYVDGSIDTIHIGDDQITGAKLNPSLVSGDIIYADGTDTINRLAKPGTPAGEVLTFATSASAPSWVAAAGGGAFENDFLHVQDQKASGTAGGTATSGAWRTRDLNTVVTNSITGCSLGSNQVTLVAGTYFVSGWGTVHRCNEHKTKIYDTTGTADLLIGGTARDYVSQDGLGCSHVSGTFTLSGTSAIEFQHRTTATLSSTGFGIAASLSVVELYVDLKIWKVA